MRDKGRVLHGRVVWKDSRDSNHGKHGWVGGNPRYKRHSRREKTGRRFHSKQFTMGKN